MTQIKSLVELAQAIEAEKSFEYEDVDGVWVVAECCDLTLIKRFYNGGKVRIKPTLKKIDLSCLVGSGVLCEFVDNGQFLDIGVNYIGLLDSFVSEEIMSDGVEWKNCRPLFNYWHHHTGGECPIPLVFVVEVELRSGAKISNALSGAWTFQWSNVAAYRITGIAEGWEL